MAENNEVIKALGQVPELVEKTEKVLEESDKKFRILAEAVQKRMLAEIPSSEVEKVSNAAAAAVSRTKCSSPNTDEVSRLVAGNITRFLTESMKSVATEAVKEAVKETPVNVEHHHTHTTLGYLTKMAEGAIHNWLIGLACTCTILLGIGIYCCFDYFNSPAYIGQQYCNICYSKFTTETEREALWSDCYSISFVPREFNKNPKLVKEKIRRNKLILEQRRIESNANKGKFSTKMPLER